MAKLTTRDRVWSTALDLAAEYAAETASWRRSFEIGEVRARMDDPPSNKTIRETLASMADLGHLDEGRGRGTYEPVEVALDEDADDEVAWSPPGRAADEADEPASADAVALAVEDDGEPVEDALAALDPPGPADEADERRAAVRAALDLVRDQGTASRQEIMDLHGDDVAGPPKAYTWYDSLVYPALQELADDLDALESGRGSWTWSP